MTSDTHVHTQHNNVS